MVLSFRASLSLIAMMIMTTGTDGQTSVEIQYNPPSVCALKGSTVRMSCYFMNPLGEEMKTIWSRTLGQSTDVCSEPENRGRVQCFSEDKNTHSITLTNVTEADENKYYCRDEINKEMWRSAEDVGAQLQVTGLQVETHETVKEKHPVTLTCKSSCSLTEETTFIWFRNTQRVSGRKVNQLHLRIVKRSDAGDYQCATGANEDLKSPPVYLNVEYPPRSVSVSINKSAEIVEGDSVILICSSNSNPPAKIHWIKGGKPVGSGGIYNISKISSDDGGEYKCRFNNTHGKKYSDPVKLNVMYPPRNVSVLINGSSEVLEGDSVRLICSSDSNPPALTFSWFQENHTSAVGSGQSFSISSFNSSLSGRFYCEAHNKYGSQRSAAASLSVKESSSSWVRLSVGDSVSAVVTSVMLMVFVYLFRQRHNKKVESENTYMNLELTSRRSVYDTLDNMRRSHENTDDPEDQDPVYNNIDI